MNDTLTPTNESVCVRTQKRTLLAYKRRKKRMDAYQKASPLPRDFIRIFDKYGKHKRTIHWTQLLWEWMKEGKYYRNNELQEMLNRSRKEINGIKKIWRQEREKYRLEHPAGNFIPFFPSPENPNVKIEFDDYKNEPEKLRMLRNAKEYSRVFE